MTNWALSELPDQCDSGFFIYDRHGLRSTTSGLQLSVSLFGQFPYSYYTAIWLTVYPNI